MPWQECALLLLPCFIIVPYFIDAFTMSAPHFLMTGSDTSPLQSRRRPFSSLRQCRDESDQDDMKGDESPTDPARMLFDEMTRELFHDSKKNGFSGRPSSNPFMSRLHRIGKGDLYSEEELQSVFMTHSQISSSESTDVLSTTRNEQQGKDEDSVLAASLHDLVRQSVESHPTTLPPADDDNKRSTLSPFQFDEATRQKIQNIRAIACDVDGTILGSRKNIHPRTRMAIKRAIYLASSSSANKMTLKGAAEMAVNEESPFLRYFFLATGKSRQGALESLGFEMESLINTNKIPGVYLQGLYCVDGEGNVLLEKKLTKETIAAAEMLAKKNNISIVGYDGDKSFTTELTKVVVMLHERCGVSLPKHICAKDEERNIENLADYEPAMHKLLLIDDDTVKLNNVIRPQLEQIAKRHGGSVTQSQPTVLELLPADCSKAIGVGKVCEALNIDMENELLAIGDAENDVEMLRMASIGVSLGNGCPKAKAAADFVLQETNDDGGAGVAIELFGYGGGELAW